ncbi:MAG: uroporphyrinogen decarboxylase family protein [Pirellulaceae bacterium]
MNEQRELRGDCDPDSIRGRLQRALDGQVVDRPVYVAYDWFVQNRPIDWPSLFEQGLGQVAHADLVTVHRPNVEMVETTQEIDGRVHRHVCWTTDRGELHEWHLGEWQREFLIKTPKDYRILQRALEGTRYGSTPEPFERAEQRIGDSGITVGQLGWTPIRRTPVLQVQVDFAGPERLAMDLLDEVPELMELLELMTELTLEKVREAAKGPARYIKLWENLTIEMLGPRQYERHLMPLYRQILEILEAAHKRLVVHYDGKTRSIAGQIASLDFDGLDSLTPAPEGDMPIAEARARWPDKFFWMNPSADWYREDRSTLAARIRQMVRDAGPRRYCLMISEEVPPNWRETVPTVLQTLDEMQVV